MEEAQLRQAIVAAGARLAARGLVVAAEGNLSVRLPGERLLITPSGRRKDALSATDAVVVDLAGTRETGATGPGPRPSSDLAIHRAIYRARPDVEAIVHAHSPAAMALTVAGERPDPGILPETALLLPRIPLVPFAAMGSHELADLVAAALADGTPQPGGVILERHGALAVGEARDGETNADAALALALDRIELIDVLCRVWRDVLLLRGARTGGSPA